MTSSFLAVRAKVYTDSTGACAEIPVVLTSAGVLSPLLDYLLSRSHDRSLAWMKKVVRSTLLFLDYLAANPEERETYKLFQNFAQRLRTGTFDRVTSDISKPKVMFSWPATRMRAFSFERLNPLPGKPDCR